MACTDCLSKEEVYTLILGTENHTTSFRLCKKCLNKLKKYEPRFLLDPDSICYGCKYYLSDEIECNPPNICVEGSMNTSNGGEENR